MSEATSNGVPPPAPVGGGQAPAKSRRWLRLLSIPIMAYLMVLVLMMSFENSLIFFPSVYPEGYWNPPYMKFEDAWFEAADGTKLHGWYVPHESPRAIVLFAHGNAGNLSHRGEAVAAVNRLGATVMVFDYRGYGRSSGKPHEAGVLSDARAARAWLAKKTAVEESQIVLWGESLGGGVMTDLAAADGARGLILESTFSSLPEVAAHHYPWLPVKLLMRTRLNSAAKIGNYRGPLLVIHGNRDTIVPFALAERLFAAAKEPKELVVIDGGDHNDARRPDFFAAIERFIGQLDDRPAR